MHNYTSISLRKDFLEVLDDAVVSDPRYSSRADFVRTAIRHELERLNKLKTGAA